MNQTKTVQSIRNKRILTFLSSPTFRYQQTLIILLFVSGTLVFLDLGLFSVSFVFGAALILITISRKPALLMPKSIMWFLFGFLIAALLSWVASEVDITFAEIKLYIQTIYWFLLAVIIYNIYPFIDKKILSKYILFSTLALLVLYVTGMPIGLTQNSVAFTVIIFAPMSFYSINKKIVKILFACLLIFLILLVGSRSGAIISFLESVLIILFSYPAFRKYIKMIILALGLLVVLLTTETTLNVIGNAVYPFNPRVGELLTNTEYVLLNDMSWLQRKAQVQKGKQIFVDNPVFGIGYRKFNDFDIKIDESKIKSDRPLRNIDNRSSHNSYINWLAETGSLGFGSMIGFFISVLFVFWKHLKYLPGCFESTLFIAFLGMLIYFYTISAYLGTSNWIMYGIIAGAANYIGNVNKVKRRIVKK